MSTDTIQKEVFLRAPRSRVWRALTNAREFGEWFKFRLEGSFEEGKSIWGGVTHPGYEHLKVEMQIEKMTAETYFSYRWHPAAIKEGVDYSNEPTTLVEFRLTDRDGGTHLTVTESGFEHIPEARRAEAFRMNGDGWSQQMTNIEAYVAKS